MLRPSLLRMLPQALACTLAACSQPPQTQAVADAKPVEATAAKAADSAAIDKRLAALNSRISKLEFDRLTSNPNAPTFAVVGNPTAQGFSLGRSEYGSFAVKVTDLVLYGAGTKISLQIVNMAGATLGNATLTVNYSNVGAWDLNAPTDDMHVDQKPVSLSSTKRFPTGVWVAETVTLPDLPPGKIRFVSIGFKADEIVALKPRAGN